MDFNKWNPFWATCFSVMAFLIIVGNSLTIATLLRKKFRKRPQFLLISLAFADLLAGCATALYVIIKWYRLIFALQFVFNMLDGFAGLSSIFHLAVISLERLHATLRPFCHRQLSLKAYWVAMATPWILSLSVGIFSMFVSHKISPQYYWSVNMIIVTFSITTSLLTTCFSYILIWVKRRRSQVRTFRQNQEARFSKTILIVTAASFITWTPFQCVIVKLLLSRSLISSSGAFFITLLRFSNSFVNFVIYFFRFPSYRKALFTLLTSVPRNE